MTWLKVHWYYFWGNLISYPMVKFDWDWLYKYYSCWMAKSSNADKENKWWKYE